jgi:hypothetical protein
MLPRLSPLFLLPATLLVATVLHAQQPTPAISPNEIVVDADCRIVTFDLRDPAHPKPRYHRDDAICHIEGENSSQRWDKVEKNGKTKNVLVNIHECEYVVQNPSLHPITFLVKVGLAKNYRIDSDPQPSEVFGSTATFRVITQPGQTVRLHVGEHD